MQLGHLERPSSSWQNKAVLHTVLPGAERGCVVFFILFLSCTRNGYRQVLWKNENRKVRRFFFLIKCEQHKSDWLFYSRSQILTKCSATADSTILQSTRRCMTNWVSISAGRCTFKVVCFRRRAECYSSHTILLIIIWVLETIGGLLCQETSRRMLAEETGVGVRMFRSRG